MSRQRLLAELSLYREHFPDETPVIGRFENFVRSCPTCFERTTAHGHLTGSAWLVDTTGERVLLTHHRKLGTWIQPGGHAEGKEQDICAVACREAREESGLVGLKLISTRIFDLDIHEIPAHRASRDQPAEAAHLHYDVRFVLQAGHDTVPRVGLESLDLAWIPIPALSEVTNDRSVLRMGRKWLCKRPW